MDGITHYEKDERPWGMFERFTLNEPSTVKIITVKAGEMFSLQKHAHRMEFWHIISGAARVTVGDKTTDAKAGDNFTISEGTLHRLEATGSDCSFLEIAYGQFDESDIIRIEDKYGRM